MAKFTYEDEQLVADEFGELSYEDAIDSVVEDAVAELEMAVWDLVDAVERIACAELEQPSNDEEDDE